MKPPAVPAAQPRGAVSLVAQAGADTGDTGVTTCVHGVRQRSAGSCRGWRQSLAALGQAAEDASAAQRQGRSS